MDGLTDEEARTNVQFLTNGWDLIEGMTYGGWRTRDWDPSVSDTDKVVKVLTAHLSE